MVWVFEVDFQALRAVFDFLQEKTNQADQGEEEYEDRADNSEDVEVVLLALVFDDQIGRAECANWAEEVGFRGCEGQDKANQDTTQSRCYQGNNKKQRVGAIIRFTWDHSNVFYNTKDNY